MLLFCPSGNGWSKTPEVMIDLLHQANRGGKTGSEREFSTESGKEVASNPSTFWTAGGIVPEGIA
jgi:hypothetical protein